MQQPRRRLRSVANDETGSSLFLASMLLLLGLLLAAGLFSLANASYRNTLHAIDGAKARYIAEAGVYRAIAQIKQNPAWQDGYSLTPFGEGVYSLQVTVKEITDSNANAQKAAKPAKIYTFFAEGAIPNRAKRTIEVSYRSDTGQILNWSD